MRKRTTTCVLLILLAAASLNGCSREREPRMQDNRMGDPAILKYDQDIQRGDADVKEYRMQSLSGTPIQMLQTSLTRVYPNPSIAPQQGSYANNVITFARYFLGTPYEYGSDRSSPATFDCSAFTRYAFLGALGMDLPYDSRSQASYVDMYSNRSYTKLSLAERGDLLFFMDYKGPYEENYRNVNPAAEKITHTGIYLGDGLMIHTASQATGGVRIDYIYGKHLEWRFVKGGAVLPYYN